MSGALALVTLTSAIPTSSAEAQSSCNPIGRITEGTSVNFRAGEVVCEGQVIREPNNVKFLCFASASVVPISGDSVTASGSLCTTASAHRESAVRSCDRRGLARLLCLVPKGPEEQFMLIQPDAVSINPRPTISWEEVPEVEAYTIRVFGPGITWERTVAASITELEYPSDEAPLLIGNAYEVIVVANLAEASITASKVVNIEGDTALYLFSDAPLLVRRG